MWGDARFAAPDIDIVDVLEQDEQAVQWNQWGKTEPDDALGGLAGSYGSPQLARMMNLSIYNEEFRRYKQRNLQSAVRTILASGAGAAGRFVAVDLDPINTSIRGSTRRSGTTTARRACASSANG